MPARYHAGSNRRSPLHRGTLASRNVTPLDWRPSTHGLVAASAVDSIFDSGRITLRMELAVFPDRVTLGRAAAERAAALIGEAVARRGLARIVAATGASQIPFLEALTARTDIDWERVELFHLDEYLGLPEAHPASFRRYLRERLIEPTGITRHHLLDAEGDVAEVVARVSREIADAPIDVAFVGIGENGHLAFNDPPADFQTEAPYLVVALDEACRRQQVGEGWFRSLAEVPTRAISMSIRQILRSREILCIVPERRKAEAVKACLTGEIRPELPASALRQHPKVTLYLDRESAALLEEGPGAE
jgi:glucosamine-6-phosphate deaminase